jgi:uncharacterized heparinase superfamily protein
MVRNLGLIYRTVKNLKFIQIFYQIFYRFKPQKDLNFYLTRYNKEIKFDALEFSLDLPYYNLLNGDRTFNFLNKTKKFDHIINWDFQEYGKLWNYNLQYFNCLNQRELPNEIKEDLLISITEALKQGNVKLEPYPVSLRAMNTIRYYSISEHKNVEVIKGLFGQLNYLSQNLEFHLLGNHLLENGFALLMGGAAFNYNKWIQKAEKLLYDELDEQILKDGAHFELSPMYHQIIFFRVLELIEWYQRWPLKNGEFLSFLHNKAAKMLSWLQQISFNNGDIPHLNDSAFDVAFTSKKLIDFSSFLKVEPLYLPLRDSGYRKYQNQNYECIIDAAALGPVYQSGHSHSDCLSFILYKQGKPFIVEPGTSTYEIGPRRSYERSTAAHNTVVIGKKNQSEVWGGFRVGKRADVRIIEETNTCFIAEHTGYIKDFGALHRREFKFLETEIHIEDCIGENEGKCALHFHPSIKCEISENGSIIINDTATLTFNTTNLPILLKYEFARGFNQYEEAFKIEINFETKIKVIIKL